jgi:hypothetical protein
MIPRAIGCVGILLLAALVAQDPSKLPLAKNARHTENGQEPKLGDGMRRPTVTLGS